MTPTPEHTCHDEWVDKAREIVLRAQVRFTTPRGWQTEFDSSKLQNDISQALRQAAGRKAATVDDKMRELGFAHPCKETCSGWKQGYDDGFGAGRKAALPPFEEFVREISDMNYTEMYHWLASRIEGEK